MRRGMLSISQPAPSISESIVGGEPFDDLADFVVGSGRRPATRLLHWIKAREPYLPYQSLDMVLLMYRSTRRTLRDGHYRIPK